MRRPALPISSLLFAGLLFLVGWALPVPAETAGISGVTTIEDEEQLPDGTGALLRREYPGWALRWVASIYFHRTRYSVLYGIKDPLSAMILLSTTADGTSRIIKADTSLFPMNEELTATPPLEARIAIAQAVIQKNAAKYASIQAYVEALKKYDMVRGLVPEQRKAIENLGGRLPPKRR
jgi:hypothetical protein